MRKLFFPMLFMLLGITNIPCHSQEGVALTKPPVVSGDNLVISYDILNSPPGEKYNVSLEITDSKGSIINAQSIEGDYGKNIAGGTNKRIVWHYKDDNVIDEVTIIIRVVIVKEEKYTRGKLMLQSVALPGLGLSRINDYKPYWIGGIVGYGLLASAAALKISSNKSQDEWNRTLDIEYWDKKEKQETMALAAVAGAAAVWIADFALIYIASSPKKGKVPDSNTTSLSLSPGFNAVNNTACFSIKYNF